MVPYLFGCKFWLQIENILESAKKQTKQKYGSEKARTSAYLTQFLAEYFPS